MAYKNPGHEREVQRSWEYRRMVTKWSAEAPVPLHIFQREYGKAFFDQRGGPHQPSSTGTSKQAFVNIMRWTGVAPDHVEDWDDWLEFNDY